MYSSNNENTYQKSPTPPIYGQPAPPYSQQAPVFGQQAPVFGQPAPPYGYPVQQGIESSWSTGICGCCDDVSNCCLTFWCPCITFGRIAEIVDKGSTTCVTAGALYALLAMVTGCGCIYSCFYRSKMRGQHMLPESPCNDCCVHFCCEACALCQEYRELKNRGLDPSLGWEGNMHRQNPGVAMGATAPMMHSGMSR